MKACIIQPPYSYDLSLSDEYFEYKLKLLDECDEMVDIIVLPEYSDVPCVTSTLEETFFYYEKYHEKLMEKCRKTAVRCRSIVFVNALSKEETGYRNTTFVISQRGDVIGKYYKKHLPPLELYTLGLDSQYTFEYSEPYVIEIDGLRYGFLTCYDFYFYEAFANIARNNVDIIIGCSLQRSDSHDAIETMCRFLAYNTNAYVLRSSVSFAEDSEICGASMVVSPRGKVLENMKGKFGKAIVEFDPHNKYYKPAGFGNPDAAHYEYIEFGRKPWQYRPAGSAIVCNDEFMPYPRVCVNWGENIMADFGAAIALGTEEITFDLQYTKDGKLVVKNVLFEDVLKKFSCHAIMNIRIPTEAKNYDEDAIKKIVSLIRKYDCEKHVYFTIAHEDVIKKFKEYVSDISICVACNENCAQTLVDRAIEYGAKKIQLDRAFLDKTLIEKAHKQGIKCNLLWSDDVKEIESFLAMGIDTIVTNEYLLVLQNVRK